MAQMDIKAWGEEQTLEFLKKEKLEKLFEGKQVTGVDLQDLKRLEQIGLNKRGDRLKVFNTVIKYLEKKSPSKVLNDPIHGLVELHPLLVKIIDTPQFQRLRYIKQLGGVYFVYPGASHNRFEHSIGVAHLAGELAKSLKTKQPELGIDDRDILCVQIAGLCHDLGHGPFSHLYDGLFLPEASDTAWQHEEASSDMLYHLVEDNGLEPLMELYGLKPEEDLVFIKDMIQGKPLKASEDQNITSVPPYEGRGEDKSFLYEIVANKQNGIDVDKFDYLARDTYHLGMQSNFDHKRFIKLVMVCKVNERNHICSRDKEMGNLYDMFHTRYYLHRRACQHKTSQIIQIMIRDAFLKADEHIKFKGEGEAKYSLSKAKDNMVAYTKLTDQVFERILYSSSPKLKEAREILERIISRDLYKFVGKTKDVMMHPALIQLMQQGQAKMAEISQEKIQSLKAALANGATEKDNFEVNIVTFDYGKSTEDPINHTYFYSKENTSKGFKIPENQKSKLLPASFSEKILWVYCKTNIIHLKHARKNFKDWCKENGFAAPEDEDIATDPNDQ